MVAVLISNGVPYDQCAERLARTADKVGSYPYNVSNPFGMWSDHMGYGRVNFYRLMKTLVPPTLDTVTPGTSQATLNWKAPVMSEFGITGYRVYRSLNTGGPYTLVASLGNVTTYTDTSAYGGSTYYYIVKGVDPYNFETRVSNELSALILGSSPTATLTLTPSQTFTPLPTVTFTRSYTLTPTVTSCATSFGGPDAFGYKYSNVAYSWVDITGSGTPLAIDGSGALTVALPFTHSHYGTVFGSLSVSSSGYLEFGGGNSAFSNHCIPSASLPTAIIAVLWGSIGIGPSYGGQLYYQTLGTTPNRTFVVEWYKALASGDTTGSAIFEVILYEGSPDVKMQYQSVAFVNPIYDNGLRETIGIENGGGTIGLQYSCNCISLYDGMAVLFSPNLSTPTITATFTPTLTSSLTLTPSMTESATASATASTTPSASNTATLSLTASLTLTPSSTFTTTHTQTYTNTPTVTTTSSGTPTRTATATPTLTTTQSFTSTSTATPTATSSDTATLTLTPSVTITHTATNTATATFTLTLTPSDTPTNTPTTTQTLTSSLTLTSSETLTSSLTPTDTLTSSETLTSSTTSTITMTLTSTYTFTRTATPVVATLAITRAVTFPNPARGDSLTFSVSLSTDSVDWVRIRVMTVAMYELNELTLAGGHFGENDLVWDLKDRHGNCLANGLYYYLIEASKKGIHATAWGKLVILK